MIFRRCDPTVGSLGAFNRISRLIKDSELFIYDLNHNLWNERWQGGNAVHRINMLWFFRKMCTLYGVLLRFKT